METLKSRSGNVMWRPKAVHRPRDGQEIADLEALLDDYSRLEKRIQTLIEPVTRSFCGQCHGRCCKREICRESLDSVFLALLVARQKARFDDGNGWLGPHGCRLDYGRPLVCYAYFCEEILKSPTLASAQLISIIDSFLSIGNRARGSTHLVCLQDIDLLSLKKINKISERIKDLSGRVGF